MTVAFFGHSDAPSEVYTLLERKIAELAEENDEITFLVGTHGAFDRMSQKALEQAVKRYPHIKAYIVLAYLPTDKEDAERYNLPMLLPEGIESVPKRWAIEYRNKFIVNECDAVICYVKHDWGGAAKFVEMARKKGKKIVNLADKQKNGLIVR